MNKILLEDFEHIYSSGLPVEEFKDSAIVITGATGLVGSMLVRTLLFCNRKNNLNMTIIALVRSIKKAENIFFEYLSDESLKFVVADLSKDEICVECDVDYIIHAASVTTSKIMIDKPVETIITAIFGTDKVLRFAVSKNIRSLVYISSMEVYGSFDSNDKHITEEQQGYVNPLVVRSNYPQSKRMCENMCIAYLSEYGVPVKIARLAQTFGAGILSTENRVFAQFARSAIKKENIVLHTLGKSEGNYSYLCETVEALLLILLKGKNGEAYNVSNEECHTTIADMAQMVANEITKGEIKVVFDIPENNSYGYAADTHMILSSDKLKVLGWNPRIGLKEAYQRMIKYIIDEEI